jgi:hypothetical protein
MCDVRFLRIDSPAVWLERWERVERLETLDGEEETGVCWRELRSTVKGRETTAELLHLLHPLDID